MLPLAWRFIRYGKAKSIGIVTAIFISVFLIGQQLSLLLFLMGLMGNLVGNAPVDANDLWVIERQSHNVNQLNSLDTRLVQQVQSVPGVLTAQPVVLANARATFLDGKTAGITLVGAPAPAFLMGPVEARIDSGQIAELSHPMKVSAEYFNARSWDTELFQGKPIEINGKSAQVAVITRNAQAFGASVMYTSLENARYLADVPIHQVHIIIVKLAAEQQKEQIAARIQQLFPNVQAWDPEKLRKSTVKEILISSNMGLSFGTLVVFAMISGFFIIGLTLYSSALDRIRDYGTLKAIGATTWYVNRLIMMQALLYALIGYLIAMLFLWGFKFGAASGGLKIDLSAGFVLFLLLVTLVISVGGSLFAVRKISKLEPASVF
ncbi:MAG TPA: ABC transporter permease [Candidatus Sphingobacterium stercorigallinarum]|nr:ABC transporter permease [Candidatus Sphingobacterium stercorigallinarum]